MITLLYNEEDDSVKVTFDMEKGNVGAEMNVMYEVLQNFEEKRALAQLKIEEEEDE